MNKRNCSLINSRAALELRWEEHGVGRGSTQQGEDCVGGRSIVLVVLRAQDLEELWGFGKIHPSWPPDNVEFPKPGAVETLCVPAQARAATMSFVSALRTWSKRFLDKKFTLPTVTDYRKYSHRVLLLLAQDREKLKEGMRVIDAHVKFMCESLKRMPSWRQLQAKQVHGNPVPHQPSDLDHEAALDDPGAFPTFPQRHPQGQTSSGPRRG